MMPGWFWIVLAVGAVIITLAGGLAGYTLGTTGGG